MLVLKNPTERQERVLTRLSKLRQSHEAGEVPHSWVIVSACTTLESAVSDKLQTLLATRATYSNDVLVQRMIKAQRNDMDRSWVTRLDWLAHGFGVKLSKVDEVDLLAMVDLRNAIAHHSDMFTSRQVNDYAKFLTTRRLLETRFLLHTRGTKFTVTADTAGKVLRVARRVATRPDLREVPRLAILVLNLDRLGSPPSVSKAARINPAREPPGQQVSLSELLPSLRRLKSHLVLVAGSEDGDQ